MTDFKTGDRVKVRPLTSVATRYHHEEGVIEKVLERNLAIWPYGVSIEGYHETQYFEDNELEYLGSNVYEKPAVIADEKDTLTEGIVDAAAVLNLLNEATDNRLDMALDYLEGRKNVYHIMFHKMEEAEDEQGQLIYALVHDEIGVAIRLLQ